MKYIDVDQHACGMHKRNSVHVITEQVEDMDTKKISLVLIEFIW